MNFFEETFLILGFSWTLSKLAPYLLFSTLAAVIGWLIFRKKESRTWVKIALIFTSTAIGFFSYFAYAPIFEGDFSNRSTNIALSKDLYTTKKSELIVITIPGCPYCAESIDRMKTIKQHTPSVKINYVVCSKLPESLDDYRKMIKGDFKLTLAKDPEAFANISKGSFPSFLLITEKAVKHWSNNDFGVMAVDEVLKEF